MSLNLWKIGGKPTSYNPLPTGFGNWLNVGIGDFIISFKAKSPTNARLLVYKQSNVNQMITLTNEFVTYQYTFSSLANNSLAFTDQDSKGDIAITDIQLVQKPLPTLTINGIDGFTAQGKWTLHANAKVISDDELELNATANFNLSKLRVSVKTNSEYQFQIETNGIVDVDFFNALGVKGRYLPNLQNTKKFTTTPNEYFIDLIFTNLTTPTGKFTFKKPMLNLGTIPAPFAKKTGERMVLPSVKGKNLFNKLDVIKGKYIDYNNGLETSIGVEGYCASGFIAIKPDTNYKITGTDEQFAFYNASKQHLSGFAFVKNFLGKTPTGAYFMRLTIKNDTELNTLQVEEGTQPTSYEPYAVQLNKKPAKPIVQAKSGLVFNGVTDSVVFNITNGDMNKGFVELKFTATSFNNGAYLIGGNPNVRCYILGNGNGTLTATMGNVPVSITYNTSVLDGKPHVARLAWDNGILYFYVDGNLVGTSPFIPTTGGGLIRLGAHTTSGDGHQRFTTLKFTYSMNEVVAQYDFENSANIVGDKVLEKAKNLIPSFEDARWSLHSNFKVFGKDVGRLDVTGVQQPSIIRMSVKPSASYYMSSGGAGRIRIGRNDNAGVGTWINEIMNGSKTFTMPSDVDMIAIALDNNAIATGTFDFIKPQLYELSGKEGTIVGKPTPLRKTSKRTLYSKR